MNFRRVSLFSIAAVCFFSFSCSTDTIWNIDTETFAESIRHGDTGFLRHIDYSEADLREIFRLGPGAAFSTAAVFEGLGMEALAADMLRLEWEEGTGLWKMHAGEEVIGRYLNDGEYEKAERNAKFFLSGYGDRYFGYRGLAEALYRQQKDREVLDLLDVLRELFPEKTAADGELALFSAVSSSRLEIPGWDDLFVAMFQEIPSSGALIRGYKYITASDRLREYFSDDELAFFNARVLTATLRYSEAADIYGELLERMSPVVSSEQVYDEIGVVFLGGGRQAEGIGLLLAHTVDQPFFYSYFSAGRLLREGREYARAYELFMAALEYAGGSPLLYERALWYGQDCLLQQAPKLFVEKLPELTERWGDPAYYADLFADAAAELTASRQWDLVWELFRVLFAAGGGPEILALYGHILLKAGEAGLYRIPFDETIPDAETIRRTVSRHHAYGYYHLLNLPAADVVPPSLAAEAAPEEGAPADAAVSGVEGEFVRSFASYALFHEMYKYALLYERKLSSTELIETASMLAGAGLFRESITLVNRGMRRESWEWTRKALELLYPKAYAHTVETAAEENGIDPWMLSALIREESYYDPEAVSRAGAVGLSQLMPATAEETARRMGLADPDLRDPEDNVTVGAYYFASLLRRFDENPLYAVCAYNAGPARMRRWAAEYKNLPAPLLVEAIPFTETRNHAKKVLVSTVVYGYLYGGRDPKTAIQHYFTGRQE
jgi:soluble lytic murein transglycosylase-like protein/tetratricopeptide (TPR) repeat protein